MYLFCRRHRRLSGLGTLETLSLPVGLVAFLAGTALALPAPRHDDTGQGPQAGVCAARQATRENWHQILSLSWWHKEVGNKEQEGDVNPEGNKKGVVWPSPPTLE